MKYIVYFVRDKEVIEADEAQCILGTYASWTLEQWGKLAPSTEVLIQVIYKEKLEDAVVLQVIAHECDTTNTVNMLRTIIREKRFSQSHLLTQVLPNRVRKTGRQSLPPLGTLWTADEATEDERDSSSRKRDENAHIALSAPPVVIELPLLPSSPATTIAKSSSNISVQTPRTTQVRGILQQSQSANKTPDRPQRQLEDACASLSSFSSRPDISIAVPQEDSVRVPPLGAFSAVPQLEAYARRQVESSGYAWGSIEGLYCLQLLNLRETLKLRDVLQRGVPNLAGVSAEASIPVNIPIRTEAELKKFHDSISTNDDIKKALVARLQTRCLCSEAQPSVRYAINELIARDFQGRFNRTGGKDPRGGDQENAKFSFDTYFGEILKDALSSKFTLERINKAIQGFFDGVRKRRSAGSTVAMPKRAAKRKRQSRGGASGSDESTASHSE